MQTPLVSVIIPIYKVEQYLEQCLDSVIKQTYHNLEIILVDDGSPDNCGAICDAYKAKDERIIVIHQENQGLSTARNAGLDICKGEYIAFVDSDDWVEPDFIEAMLDAADENTIVACGFVRREEKSEEKFVVKKNKTLTSKEVIEAYVYMLPVWQYIQGYVWLKLYPRKIFLELRFPAGKNFEDLYIHIDIFHNIDKLIVINKCLYNYRIREDSIVNTLTKKYFADIQAGIEHNEVVLRDKFQDTYSLEMRLANCLCGELIVYYRNDLTLTKEELAEIKIKLWKCIERTDNISHKLRFKVSLLLLCPYLFISIWYVKNKFLPYLKCLYKKIFFFR